MHQKIDLLKPLPCRGEELFDLVILGHIDRMQPFIGKPHFRHGLADPPLRFLGVVHRQKSEPAFGALPNRMMGDMRRDAAIVGDVED